MGCDSIAIIISRMGKKPTILGPQDLKVVSSLWDTIFSVLGFFLFVCGACPKYLPGGNGVAPIPNFSLKQYFKNDLVRLGTCLIVVIEAILPMTMAVN